MAGGYCTVLDCEREEETAGLCSGHRKRLTRGLAVATPLRGNGSPWQRFQEAILAYADTDAEDDEQFQRNRIRLRKAGEAWALSLMRQRSRRRIGRRTLGSRPEFGQRP